ncbi:MAG: MBL fold metallo-hydrolase [Candidatus Nanohaloarchaea archaeon]|nr:MBL fold metallo-hydrolase [Candidatus Nanohaloarchaea archaeon]
MSRTAIRGVEIEWIGHAAVKLDGSSTVVIDIYPDVLEQTTGEPSSADLIVSTHPHFDHFDPDTINQIADGDTTLIARDGTDLDEVTCSTQQLGPGESSTFDDVRVEAVEAYNDHRFRDKDTPYHPQGLGMGVLIELDDLLFYHTGDTDFIDEMEELGDRDIDVAFLPIGGTYTMDSEEAVEAVKTIQPHKVVPIHYNFIDGTEADPYSFQERVEQETDTDVIILEDH